MAQEGEDQPQGEAGMEMPAWMELGDEHAALKKFAGEWTAVSKFWMAPGAEPMVGAATARAEMILGGRFLRQVYKAKYGPQDFEGHLHVGYDTVNNVYVSTWIDNMSPYLYVTRGPAVDGVTWLDGEEPDMMSGQMKRTVMSIQWTDADTWVLAAYDLGPDHSKTQRMEITYSRKK